MTVGEPQSIGGWTDGEPYNDACKDVRYLPLRSSRLRDVSFDVPSAAFVCLIGARLCRGQTACRGCSHSASLCVSCLAPTLDVTETRFHGYRDHQHRRRHKGRASQPEICAYLAPRTVASVQLSLLGPPSCLGPWNFYALDKSNAYVYQSQENALQRSCQSKLPALYPPSRRYHRA